MMKITHGSLFSGIGEFDLAAQWMGWENIFHCEWNPFGQRVLKYHFPKSISYADITKTDFTIHKGTIDILTGGFPCQPYSAAGKRRGKADERHLWPEMLRSIREIQPSYVVGENVRGLTNWNGGLVFDEVQSDLETEGYEVLPFLLPACAVNAPHRRDRIWFIANRNDKSVESRLDANRREDSKCFAHNREEIRNNADSISESKDASDSDCYGCDGSDGKHEKHTSYGRFDALDDAQQTSLHTNSNGLEGRLQEGKRTFSGSVIEKSTTQNRGGGRWHNFPTQPPLCIGNDGLPFELDGITFSKWRDESIKAFGNAIVPQVAYEIFKVIAKTL